MSTVNQYAVGVSIDGVNLGIFDKMTGGAIDSEETKYKPGGMAPQVSLGGSRMVENITVTRLYQLNRDHGLVNMLRDKVGKGVVTIVKQPLDAEGNAFGSPSTYSGRLKRIQEPEPDSESSDPAMLELEVSTAGTVS